MKAFRVSLDGRDLGDLGVADQFHLGCRIDFSAIGEASKPREFEGGIHVYGLAFPRGGVPEQGRWVADAFEWERLPISVGSRIQIEVVETDVAVPPPRRIKQSRPASYETEDEERERRYSYYLRLKEEFEGSGAP